MKKIMTAILAAALLVALLAGCGSKALSADDAKKVVLKDLGVTESQVTDIHVHIANSDDGTACYSIYLTVNGKQMEYLIHGITGEILSSGEGSHSH